MLSKLNGKSMEWTFVHSRDKTLHHLMGQKFEMTKVLIFLAVYVYWHGSKVQRINSEVHLNIVNIPPFSPFLTLRNQL